MVHSFIHC